MEPPSWPPPPEPPAARPQLRRSRSDKILGGVNGGLAEYSGIDAVLWRVGAIGLTVAGGAGVVVYLLLWVLLPSAPLPADRSPSIVDGAVDRLHTALVGTRTGPAPTDRG
jgi:phage shock protein PspC (stress-responsive transcriptional regulator)